MTQFSPEDLPEWLAKSVQALDDRASEMVRTSPNAERAAGYFQAVAELKETIETEKKLAEAERKARFRKAVNDAA